jgi:hypothetical protein
LVRGRAIAVGLALFLVGCGSESASPVAPSSPGASTGLNGTWVQTNGDTRTWVLEQGGLQASGVAGFSQANHPSVGAISGTGGVLGAVSGGAFRFAETYEGLNIPSRPSPNNCYVDTEGSLGINGNTMRGTVTEPWDVPVSESAR